MSGPAQQAVFQSVKACIFETGNMADSAESFHLELGKKPGYIGPVKARGKPMGLIVGLVILMFALACAAVCWEESRNLPKPKCRKKSPEADRDLLPGLLRNRG